ncbi:MAG: SdrD B-like domain-containing protein, partial [Gemmatimonas sp.]
MVTATGSGAIVSYSLSGAPSWMTITSDGQLQGTPTASAGAVTFTINATDANGCSGSTTRSVTVVCPTITITNGIAMQSVAGTAYTQATGFAASSNTALNTAGYGWSLVTPPAGFTLGGTDGKLTVANTVAAGLYSLSVRATANSPYATCAQTQAASFRVCPVFTWTPASLPSAILGVNYNLISGTQVAATGSAAITGYTLSGAPAWLAINSSGQLSGTPPAAATGVTFTVNATDANGCTGSRAYTINVANLCAGNLVFIDMNNDGVRQSTEAGVPNLALQIWNAGADGVRGGGNDTLTATTTTDWNGAYQFSGLAPASYFIRIATPPVYHPQVAAGGVNLDNGVNTDHNAIQPGGSGTEVFSPVFALSAGTEPAAGVDGDGTDCDSTIDFGFANLDPCYVTANNKFANPSFEVQGLPNTTGTGAALLGYNGTCTPSQSANQNAFQWVGGVNGTSGVGEPVQGVQIQATAGGGSVAWVESMKARHGRRMMLLQNTGAGVAMRPASGTWSTQLVAGGEYQLSVWAANASASSAGILWSFAASSGQVIQVISGAAPGFYQSYSVPQSEMTGTPTPGFTSADYTATNWSEATANSAQPTWRQFTYQFRINPAATAAEIDGLGIVLGAAASSGPVVVDHVALCAVNIPPTLVLGGTIWNDNNNDGQLAAETAFAAGVISGITLHRSTNTIVGDGDDVLHATGATLAPSGLFNYRFTNLPAGNYYVQLTPPATSARSGGTPVNLDNNINNDNNGVQPGAAGTQIRTPMITLAAGTEPVNDGDTNPDTNYTADIGLWSGFTLGDQIWIDTNGNGTFENGTDSVSGLTTVNVELLDSLNAVVATTQPNTSGQYSFTIYTAGSYKVRLPVPPATAPLLALNSVTLDNGANNDNNGVQPGLQGSAITSATITLTAGAEPPPSGVTNTDNTLDIGVRPCPA